MLHLPLVYKLWIISTRTFTVKKMFGLLFIVILAVAAGEEKNDPVSYQVVNFKKGTEGPIGIMTTSSGSPVEETATNTMNNNLINNEHFLDSMTHVLRERVAERMVHAKGSGALGYFETTHDITHICSAKLFSEIGKRTPVAVRFSPGVSSRGGRDTGRESRGFSVKFYTEDGNFDFTGLNLPMYSYKDPLLFPSLIHATRPNPSTNLPDPNMLWDFATLHPETLHAFMFLFSDRGIPKSYRFMEGHAIHTFQVYNKNGDSSFVRFHFYPLGGTQNLNTTEANKISTTDPDYFTRDLYNAIGNSDFPSWEFSVQILSPEDVENAAFDVFDTTKLLPLKDYPLHPVGKLVLNRNPVNYHAEIELLAFNPGNIVPGILGSPDKLYEGRRFAYRDAENYRLGINFNNIPVNCPLHASTYNRDGLPPVNENGKDIPNYYPNSFNGPVPYSNKKLPSLIKIYEEQPNNFHQAGDFYINELTSSERSNLVENIVTNICLCQKPTKQRVVKWLKIIHPDLGKRVAKGIAANC